MKKSILIVDDEEQILKAMKRIFMDSDFCILTADSASEALKLLVEHDVNLIITDLKMPEINGYEFLKIVRDKYPSIIRVVLSGHFDESLLLKIKKDSLAKLYLLKPWKNENLIRTIDQLFEVEELLKSKNLLEIINKIGALPSPSKTYNRYKALIEEDADIKNIAKVIEEDVSVTAKILQIANSAFYGVRTGSVKQAIAYLGLANVSDIVLTACIYEGLNFRTNTSANTEMDIMWMHSNTTNKITANLYNRIFGKPIPDVCFAAGLLHDIGRVVLRNCFSHEYRRVNNQINREETYRLLEEDEFMGISHQIIGGYFLNWWELPHPIIETALFHHNPLDNKVIEKDLVALVHVAGAYSWNKLCGISVKEIITPEVLKYLGITNKDCDYMIKEIQIV